METQPTLIQKRIEDTVTNGRGYSNTLEGYPALPFFDSKEGVQLRLGCTEVESRNLSKEGTKALSDLIKSQIIKAYWDNTDLDSLSALKTLNAIAYELLDYTRPELTQLTPEEDFGTYYLKNI